MPVREYVAELKKNLAQKDATELTHRRALQNLIESDVGAPAGAPSSVEAGSAHPAAKK